ncbi:PaaI family thioesterase [Pseudogemmobacter sonorensis]|uniref:PaaI family thioesterase n=1 Tax=Pseudogemmobacter sonorensis TaxID=2989681 RepID=UPI003696B899
MDDILTQARRFITALPHAKALGMTLEELGAGRAVISMPWDERLVGDPSTGVIHGGAVSTLMDTASGTAVMSHPAGPASTATLDLRIDYMRPAVPGQRIRARAECHHITRSVAFVRVVATDDNEARPVAMGNGAFIVEPHGKPEAKAFGKGRKEAPHD